MTAPSASRFAPGVIRYCFDETTDHTPMPNRSVGLTGLLKMTGLVAESGCVLPPTFVEMRDRFLAFSQLAATAAPIMTGRLFASLRDGTGDPALWFSCAMAEAGAGSVERRSEVLAVVHDAMEAELRGLYMPVAQAHYRELASKFDTAAQGFERCARVVDPGADPGEVVNARDKTVRAWRDALAFAGQLDGLLPALTAAAELVRPVTLPTGLGVSRDVFELPLVADVDGIHKRIAWASWKDWAEPKPLNPDTPALSIESVTAEPPDTVQNTRCGRWTRLVRCDAVIRAHPDPGELVLFGQAAPIVVAPVWDGHARRHLLRRIDPEGEVPNPDAPKRGPLSRLRDAFRRIPDQPEAEAEPDVLSTVAFDDPEGA
ncbi:hypothetical protein A5692_11615 [Mycobacterium sp. E342]|uniref:hypothetical protein n=1 Tax=Mycobacterium sp. E342 TaxID=1834147 RepID=UPI000801CBEB|nr:hypothetical protein [Mycobacterium sp. E342]OBH35398.1 hypothetical protein A5692_11615 [Mycobacterium sp. E342]